MTCCDHGYGRPSWPPLVSAPATYRSGTPRNQHPAVARWQAHLRGLATAIHEISGLIRCTTYYELFIPAQYVPVATTAIDNFSEESGGIFLSIRYTRFVCLQRQYCFL